MIAIIEETVLFRYFPQFLRILRRGFSGTVALKQIPLGWTAGCDMDHPHDYPTLMSVFRQSPSSARTHWEECLGSPFSALHLTRHVEQDFLRHVEVDAAQTRASKGGLCRSGGLGWTWPLVSGVWHFQRKTRDRNMQSMVLHLAVTNAVRGHNTRQPSQEHHAWRWEGRGAS